MTERNSHGRRGRSIPRWGVVLLAALLLHSPNIIGRDYPPEVGSPEPFKPPTPAVIKLPNGLSVVVVERHALPLLTLHLVVRSGAESDPLQLPGTAQLTAEVLTQGTARRSARAISEAVDAMGGHLSSSGGWDLSTVELTVLSDKTDQAFDLLADLARNPVFLTEEVERKRQQTISALDLLRDDPEYMADALFDVLVFEGTPYGHPSDGTSETIRRLSREDLERFHSQHYLPKNCILALVGDINAKEARAQAEKFFGSWQGSAPSTPAVSPSTSTTARRRIVVADKPDAVQTEIRVGNPATRRDSPEYYALTMANQILGGPAVNRLFSLLRSRRGLAYGASSEITLQQTAGSWMAKTSTRTSETLHSLEATLNEIERLRSDRVGEHELRMAKSYLIGHMALEFETSSDIASQNLELIIHGLPLDYWADYAGKLSETQSSAVSLAAEKYLSRDNQVIVLVGDAQRFRRELRKIGPVELIPLKELDLASPDLRKHGP